MPRVYTKLFSEEEARARNNESRYRYKASPAGRRMTFKSMLKRSYNVTIDEYDEAVRRQAGRCALCDSTDLHIDHCHTTGKFRGLLCRVHNVAIGALGDDEAGLTRALEYVRG